jgi:hypothetical protein
VKPVADIVNEMVSEFQTVAGRMGGMAQGF